jgi:WD40 repeat protein
MILWDVVHQQQVCTVFGTDGIQSIATSPDGQFIAMGARGGAIHVWQRIESPPGATTNPVLRHRSNQNYADHIQHVAVFCAHQGRVYALEILPDSRRLVSVGQDGDVVIWPVASSLHSTTITIAEPIDDFVFVAGDHRVAVRTSKAVYLVDADDGRVQRKLDADASNWIGLVASPEGQRLLGVDAAGSVCVWDCSTGASVGRWAMPRDEAMPALAMAQGGKWLAATTWHHPPDTVSLLEPLTGELLRTFPALSSCAVAFSPDDRLLALGSANDLYVWDLTTNQRMYVLHGHANTIRDIKFSPSGDLIATASNDRHIRIWDTATGRVRFTLCGHRNAIRSVAFSPDGRSLVSADAGGVLKVWHVPTGQELMELVRVNRGIHKVAFSPDGQRLAYLEYNGKAHVIQLSDGGD